MSSRLDEAVEVFDTSPGYESCATLLREANRAWWSGMIPDKRFRDIVERVAEWLADE